MRLTFVADSPPLGSRRLASTLSLRTLYRISLRSYTGTDQRAAVSVAVPKCFSPADVDAFLAAWCHHCLRLAHARLLQHRAYTPFAQLKMHPKLSSKSVLVAQNNPAMKLGFDLISDADFSNNRVVTVSNKIRVSVPVFTRIQL